MYLVLIIVSSSSSCSQWCGLQVWWRFVGVVQRLSVCCVHPRSRRSLLGVVVVVVVGGGGGVWLLLRSLFALDAVAICCCCGCYLLLLQLLLFVVVVVVFVVVRALGHRPYYILVCTYRRGEYVMLLGLMTRTQKALKRHSEGDCGCLCFHTFTKRLEQCARDPSLRTLLVHTSGRLSTDIRSSI